MFISLRLEKQGELHRRQKLKCPVSVPVPLSSCGAFGIPASQLKTRSGLPSRHRHPLKLTSSTEMAGKCSRLFSKVSVPSVARTTMESMLAISRAGPHCGSKLICRSSECARFFQSALSDEFYSYFNPLKRLSSAIPNLE